MNFRDPFHVKPPKGVDVTKIKPASAPPSNSTADPDIVYPDLPTDGLIEDVALSPDERLRMAEAELDEAETLVRVTTKQLERWEKTLLLRKENLDRIKKK